ncbi:MAG: acetyl-CoA C-acetyltransferase [Candidatus Muirbacterium halophilum]|nr:acetyl-CoA C-acetyltransferase [Candidatus Muirbacterium halophilum]MCK9475134.1 acetyl-CoA C-acetyltransferase [Candidatus Muirbacterium halophilum]
MREVYIVDAVRTAVGSFNGALSGVSAVELGTTVVKSILERNALKGEEIDEVIMGCILQAGIGQNLARQSAINSGIPVEKTAVTVNMVCGSGLRTVEMAAQAIMCEDAELIIAGGAESMTNAPYLLPKARNGYRMGHGEIIDSMIKDGLTDIFNDYHMGITAENIAEKMNISKEEQDKFAVSSQNKAEKAQKDGKFKDEIVPVLIPMRKKDPIVFEEDEYIKKGVTYESVSKVRSAFKKDGTVSAANASGINDGAAAVLLASEQACKKYNLKKIAKIVSYAQAGVSPDVMGLGPIPAVKKAISKAKWEISDLDLIEANEAFAVQSIAVNRELAWDTQKVNVNGGAIALGHPVGASGTRILVTLIHEMKRRNNKKGIATLCIGGGMGIAVCVEMI